MTIQFVGVCFGYGRTCGGKSENHFFLSREHNQFFLLRACAPPLRELRTDRFCRAMKSGYFLL